MPKQNIQEYKINDLIKVTGRINKRLRNIEKNDLNHIYSRLGKVEGKIVVLVGISVTIAGGVAILVINTFI